MKQSIAMKKQVRKIQRWLSKHERPSGYNIKLHPCGLYDEYDRLMALSRRGVVIAHGGGCVVETWTCYKTSQLNRLFNAAKKLHSKLEHSVQSR